MPISEKTRRILWARSGNRCAICRNPLVLDATRSSSASIVGEECHIVAQSAGGPRASPDVDVEDIDEIENLLLLCAVHHKLVDDQHETYTVKILRELKKNHEIWVDGSLTEQAGRNRAWGWSPDPLAFETLQVRSRQSALENYRAGIIQFIKQNLSAAKKGFRLAETDRTLQAFALNRRANCLRIEKKYRVAVKAYESSIRYATRIIREDERRLMLVNSWHDLGWCLRKVAEPLLGIESQKKRWRQLQHAAQIAFLKAAELDPTFSKAWFNAGQVCIDRNEVDHAKIYNLKAFALNTEYHRPAYNLAWIYAEEGDETSALAWLERTLQIDATQVYNAEASDSFKKLKDKRKLRELFEEAKRAVAQP